MVQFLSCGTNMYGVDAHNKHNYFLSTFLGENPVFPTQPSSDFPPTWASMPHLFHCDHFHGARHVILTYFMLLATPTGDYSASSLAQNLFRYANVHCLCCYCGFVETPCELVICLPPTSGQHQQGYATAKSRSFCWRVVEAIDVSSNTGDAISEQRRRSKCLHSCYSAFVSWTVALCEARSWWQAHHIPAHRCLLLSADSTPGASFPNF